MQIERFRGLVDGVYAFSMTLLVLSLVLPAGVNDADALGTALAGLLPSVGVYAFAFVIQFSWWRTHHRTLDVHSQLDHVVLPLHALALLLVTTVPFTTDTWGRFVGDHRAGVLFALNHVLLTFVFLTAVAFARARGLVEPTRARAAVRSFAIVLALFVALALIAYLFPSYALGVGLFVALLYFLPIPGTRLLWGGVSQSGLKRRGRVRRT